jgi:tripartite-type tricarboxylate transporter receptor subunit TctC
MALGAGNPRTREITTLAGLVEMARGRPGVVTYASGGNGNLQHVNMELFCSIAGIKLLHVPYRGAAPAENALVAGEVDCMLETPSAGPLFGSGHLRPLASSGATRWRDLPDVPTMAEAGYPGFVVSFWNGLVAPAGLPGPILERLVAAMQAAAMAPATRALLLSQGEVMVLAPVAFRDRIIADIARNKAVIQSAGIEMQ